MKASRKSLRDFLSAINFVRTAGTEGERRAADSICAMLEGLGAAVERENFSLPVGRTEHAALEVTAPYRKVYDAAAVALSGSTPEEGIFAQLKYVEDAEEANLNGVSGSVALINRLSPDIYGKVTKAGARAFITFSGSCTGTERDDLEVKNLRDTHLTFGAIPGINISARDAAELVRRSASEVRITLRQQEIACESQNIVAEVRGTEFPEKRICFVSHYDTVPFSPGMYDNGSGCAANYELFRMFFRQLPRRTLRFIWFGAEERGLLGSKEYVRRHREELENCELIINIDSAGLAIGSNKAFVTGDEEICAVLRAYALEKGFPLETAQDVYSSDGIPFADAGIPVVNFCRFGPDGSVGIHSRHDVSSQLDMKKLAEMTDFIFSFASMLADPQLFPLKPGIPDNMRSLLDKHLQKDLLSADKSKL